jgi:putative endonuclease
MTPIRDLGRLFDVVRLARDPGSPRLRASVGTHASLQRLRRKWRARRVIVALHYAWRATMKRPCVYILASIRNGTLYIGVTSDLAGRVSIHVQDLVPGFTAKHRVHRLVYYEMHETMEAAIKREKQLKKWNRLWKLRLIEEANPEWIDLFDHQSGAIADLPGDVERRRS